MSGLVVRNLVVRRGAAEIVRGVSFSVAPGERVALVGPSGAGKTTLLRALVGLEPDWTGELAWDGRTLRDRGPREWRRTLVLLPQRPAVFPGTVLENLRFAALHHGLEVDGTELLDALDLAAAADRPAEALSEGERQRLALARALAVRPAMLLLDEPTSALDPDRVSRVEALLARSAVGLVVVTHDAVQAARLADRHLRLLEGRVAAPEGSPKASPEASPKASPEASPKASPEASP